MQEQTPEALQAYMAGVEGRGLGSMPKQRRRRGDRSLADCNSSAKQGAAGSCMRENNSSVNRPSSVSGKKQV